MLTLSVSKVRMYLFFLSYLWLVTRMKFSWRRLGQDSPAKEPPMILSRRHSLQDLSVKRSIDVIDYMGAVRTAHANYPVVMRDFGRRILFSFHSWKSGLPFWIRYFCARGRDHFLDLDGNAFWMFQISISFKIQPGVFPGFATLEKYAYGSWSSTICCCSADYGLYSCPLPAYSMHRQPPLNTSGSITYYSASRVPISNTHLWRL